MLSIIGDRGLQFASRLWRSFQKGLGTKVKLRTTFHPQIDGQAERAIKLLEDMLSSCIIVFKENFDKNLPLVEFSYNNFYHSSKSMAPCKDFYCRRCRYPIGVFEVGESSLLVP